MPEHREWRDGYDSPQARPDQRVSYESRRERARRERLRQELADEGMWDRVSSCAKKRRYATYDQARAVARWGEEENGRELRIYKCEYCGGWHLTHKLDQKVYGREAGREATERIAREQAESTAAAPLARWSVGDLVLDLASNTPCIVEAVGQMDDEPAYQLASADESCELGWVRESDVAEA